MSRTVDWTRDIDIDLGLTEIRDCNDEPWTLRALAGASVGVDIEDALSAARELSETVNGLMACADGAKASLARILGGRGNDYQRCLWYNLAGRDPLGTSVDLARLVGLLAARAALAQASVVAMSGVTFARDPYVTEDADGPVGIFDADFSLDRQWQPFAAML
jgi:hypothetical protein